MEHTRKIVIIGATSAIAEHCARQWVQGRQVDLTLVARNAEKLQRITTDLQARSPKSDIRQHILADFLDPDEIQRAVAAITEQDTIDIVLIAHGMLPEQDDCQHDLHACREALEVNAISPVLFAEAFTSRLIQKNHGTLAIIGSVAGDRGRKSNYVYGAAKGLVTRYAQGLQHRLALARSNVKVVLIKPGPTDTPMTANRPGKNTSLAPVEEVAGSILKAIERGQASVYAPGRWRLIMWVLRHLPAPVFNKMDI